tara:strand:+ start:503 stop:1120 length:618 start_codon:yes stop_codon:yes gene_type:complete
MADYNDINKSFDSGLYGTRAGGSVALNTALENAFGTPHPINNTASNSEVTSTGRGGEFSLSAANNSMSLLSSSSHHTFANDKVIGLLYNYVPAATGAHIMTHHLEDPVTGGGNAGVAKHAAATIKFAGNYFNGAEAGKHRKIALITARGNTITYTINKHETAHHRHCFTATGSGGPDFTDGNKNELGDAGAVGPNIRRLVALGYR